MKTVWCMYVSRALQKHIELKTCLDARATTLKGDELRLRQALINLLDNAIKIYSRRRPGRATGHPVRRGELTSPDNRSFQFLWSIPGIGIAPTDRTRLFQTFVQIDSSLNRPVFWHRARARDGKTHCRTTRRQYRSRESTQSGELLYPALTPGLT